MARIERPAGRKSRKSPTNRNSNPNTSSKPGKSLSRASKSARPKESEPARWTFFSNHAHVLICLYQDSEMVLRDIASRVGITERAVQRIVQDLEDAGFVKRERVGRRNHYQVRHNMPLRHPIEEHCTVDMLFDVILQNK